MLPEDLAALIAKGIFVISAAMILCMAKVRAQEINHAPVIEVVSSLAAAQRV